MGVAIIDPWRYKVCEQAVRGFLGTEAGRRVYRVDLSDQKEHFSKAYIRAVASVAGFAVSGQEPDKDSIDMFLAARGKRGTVRSPMIGVQAKCTSREVLRDDGIHYPLERKNYDDLRQDDYTVPRILVVVVVPDNIEQWLRQTEEEMAMRHCGYWSSLLGMPSTKNETTITIEIPRSQQFTPQALKDLMDRAGAGGRPLPQTGFAAIADKHLMERDGAGGRP